ncbi:MAG TPA: hypothetical protein VKU36_02715 [Candidatus Babeliales bacterium]|nr:hypothetical protein [Candidatus Babeliales bacterium]
MKKLVLVSLIIAPALYALTQAEATKKGENLLQVLVGAHTRAFGHKDLLTASLDTGDWNRAITEIKSFVTSIINENTNFFGMRDSTLVNALDKISKAEIDLVNSIKVSRGLISSPAELKKQADILTKIANDMIAVQKTLTMKSSSAIKNEGQKILKNVAVFIEVTATKAKKDISAAI